MQAAIVAMAAHTFLTISASPSSHTLLATFPSHSSPPLHSSFHGVSLKRPLPSNLTLYAVAPNPLTIVAATKQAVAVLKGNSNVEGVATLTQESDGLFLCFNSCLKFFLFNYMILFLLFWVFFFFCEFIEEFEVGFLVDITNMRKFLANQNCHETGDVR